MVLKPAAAYLDIVRRVGTFNVGGRLQRVQ